MGTRVDAGLTPNGRASVLIHELAHALVRADRQDGDPEHRHVATVVLRTSSGMVIHARLQRHGRRQAFFLIASGRKLPGRVDALSSTGKVLRHMTFQGSAELCRSDAGVDNPLEVTYPF